MDDEIQKEHWCKKLTSSMPNYMKSNWRKITSYLRARFTTVFVILTLVLDFYRNGCSWTDFMGCLLLMVICWRSLYIVIYDCILFMKESGPRCPKSESFSVQLRVALSSGLLKTDGGCGFEFLRAEDILKLMKRYK